MENNSSNLQITKSKGLTHNSLDYNPQDAESTPGNNSSKTVAACVSGQSDSESKFEESVNRIKWMY